VSVYLNLTPGTYLAIDHASTATTPPVTVFTVTRSHHPAAMPNGAQALATGEYGWDGALSHGQGFESVVSQTPGYWVIACFMDTQDGREHTTLGMEKVIHIVK
jgi:hypothetical protein